MDKIPVSIATDGREARGSGSRLVRLCWRPIATAGLFVKRVWVEYCCQDVLVDLLVPYFPILALAILLFISEKPPSSLLVRADLLLLSAVLFAEAALTAGRAKIWEGDAADGAPSSEATMTTGRAQIGSKVAMLGVACSMLLAGIVLVYEFEGGSGPLHYLLSARIHSDRFQYFQIAIAALALTAGFGVRASIYRADRDDGGNVKPTEVPISEAVGFYDRFSGQYHEQFQNDKLVQKTYGKIETMIAGLTGSLDANRKGRVLDLGGGSGLLALGFRGSSGIEWTCCDASLGMLRIFDEVFAGSSLCPNSRHCRLEEISNVFEHGCFDIVVAAFVLSSLEELPDFEEIGCLLRPGGLLIIADVQQSAGDVVGEGGELTFQARGDWAASYGEYQSLQLAPVALLDITERVYRAGLLLKEAPQRVVVGSGESRREGFICVFLR